MSYSTLQDFSIKGLTVVSCFLSVIVSVLFWQSMTLNVCYKIGFSIAACLFEGVKFACLPHVRSSYLVGRYGRALVSAIIFVGLSLMSIFAAVVSLNGSLSMIENETVKSSTQHQELMAAIDLSNSKIQSMLEHANTDLKNGYRERSRSTYEAISQESLRIDALRQQLTSLTAEASTLAHGIDISDSLMTMIILFLGTLLEVSTGYLLLRCQEIGAGKIVSQSGEVPQLGDRPNGFIKMAANDIFWLGRFSTVEDKTDFTRSVTEEDKKSSLKAAKILENRKRLKLLKQSKIRSSNEHCFSHAVLATCATKGVPSSKGASLSEVQLSLNGVSSVPEKRGTPKDEVQLKAISVPKVKIVAGSQEQFPMKTVPQVGKSVPETIKTVPSVPKSCKSVPINEVQSKAISVPGIRSTISDEVHFEGKTVPDKLEKRGTSEDEVQLNETSVPKIRGALNREVHLGVKPASRKIEAEEKESIIKVVAKEIVGQKVKPSVRSIKKAFKVGTKTAASALKMLTDEGVLSRHGVGYVLCEQK